MKRNFALGALVRASFSSLDDARVLLDLLNRDIPSFFPEKHGSSEPLRDAFDDNGVAQAWQSRYMWSASLGRVEGTVFKREFEHEPHSTVLIRAEPETVSQSEAVSFLQHLSNAFQADFAFAHVLTKEESELGAPGVYGFADTAGDEPLLTISTRILSRFIPDVYWATIFGPPYVSLFGGQKLLSTPVADAHLIDDERMYLQMTPTLGDIRLNYEGFERARARIKEHLDHRAFWQRGDWNLRQQYRAPDFSHDRFS